MMRFEFVCDVCGEVVPFYGRIGFTPPAPTHCDQLARRLYHALPTTVQWDRRDYMEMAYRGEAQVPGLSTQEVRQTIDKWD